MLAIEHYSARQSVVGNISSQALLY